MKNIIISFTIVFLLSSCSATTAKDKQMLERAIEAQIEHNEFVGVAIGKYSLPGGVNYWNFGNISKSSSVVPSKDYIFEIGSISKVFTGLVLASLHLEKKVLITDTVDIYIEELKNTPVGKVKLVELSTHMSGLPRIPTNLVNYDLKDPYIEYTSKKLIAYLASIKNLKKPSSFSWKNYSNLGVGLLGYTLQKATGKDYDQLVSLYITTPLEMESTAKEPSHLNSKLFTTGHDQFLKRTPFWTMRDALDGAGALKSTTANMIKFIRANIHPEKTSIEKAIRFAQKPQHLIDGRGIALGWAVKVEDNQVIGIGHNGGTGGYVSNLQISLADKKGMISLTNTATDPQCIVEILIMDENCTPKLSRRVNVDLLMKYEGTFFNKKTGILIKLSSHNNQLVYEIPGQEIGKAVSITDQKFSLKGIAILEFKKGFDSFEFKQGGQTFIFYRKK